MPEHIEFLEQGGRKRTHFRAIDVPRVSARLLPRTRLISMLNAEPVPALTVVQAGSGFGKTSLLAQWARSRTEGEPLVWITADESFDDPAEFWGDVLRGMTRAGLLGDGERVDAEQGMASAVSIPLRRTFAGLRTPVTLVIDGFERLVGTEVERRLIELLALTDNLRLVIATQVPSEIGTAATASHLDMLVVDPTALRFTRDEVQQLSARLGVASSQRELEQLAAELDGWPFGIRAVLERHLRASTATSARPGDRNAASSQTPALDVGYISSRLLHSLRELPMLDQLAETSILESFDLEQAAVLGFGLDAHPLLQELEVRGMGTWRADADPPEYHLHPALRRALRDRLDEERIRAAYSRLALWHVARGEFSAAFETAVRAGEWALAGRCVRSDMLEVLVLLRLHPDVLDGVPRAVLRQEPLLMLVSGIAHYGAGRQVKAVRMLLAAVAVFENLRGAGRRAPTPDQVWMQGILTIALRLAGRYEIVPAALRRFSRMLEEVHDPEGLLEPTTLLFRTQSMITLSFMDELETAEHLALHTVREPHPVSAFQRSNLQGLTAFIHARRGDPARSTALLQSMAETGTSQHFEDSIFAVPAHVAAAWTALERFDAAAAEGALRRTESHWPTMEYWPFVLEARVHADWQLRGAETALLTLREGRSEKRFTAPIGDAMVLMHVALEAELMLAVGLGTEALSLLTAERLRRSTRLEVPKSRSLLLTGNWNQAAGIADRHAHSTLLPWHSRVDLLLISASANLRAGDRSTAQARFDQAAAIAERVGVRLPFASMPRNDLITLGFRRPALINQVRGRATRYPEPEMIVALSRREQHVLAALASNRTLPEIAQTLSVSTNTLKSQLRSVYRKLDVKNRQEAVSFARRTGLTVMSPDPQQETRAQK